MTDFLPDPLVPVEVDLRGLDYMPFFGLHLFGSEFNALCSDAEWRAGLTLWWAAWNQQPAGSLPNDDAALCRLADLGRDLKTWNKIKTRALHGFKLCADGRIYHEFLCKQVMVAWKKRVQEREKKRKWREGQDRDKAAKEPGQERGHGSGQIGSADRDNMGDGTADVTRRDVTGRDGTSKSKSLRTPRAPVGLKTLTDLGVDPQFAADWLKVREKKRAPLTVTALDDLKAQAAKAGITIAQAVAICARRSWQGFNASWNWQDDPQQIAAAAPTCARCKVELGNFVVTQEGRMCSSCHDKYSRERH